MSQPSDPPGPPYGRPRWLVGVIAGAVAGSLLVTGGVLAVLASRSETAAPTPPPATSSVDALPPVSPPPSGHPTPGGWVAPDLDPTAPPGGEFGPAPRLCEAADFSPVFALVPLREVTVERELLSLVYSTVCSMRLEGDSRHGNMDATARIYTSDEAARGGFEREVGRLAGDPHPDPGLAADWDAVAATVQPGEPAVRVSLAVLDAPLVLQLNFEINTDGADADAQLAALGEVASSIREALRR